jgi:hypothetical protein
VADVGLVYSQQTATYYGGDSARAKVEDHTLGWYQALLEARIPFEMVHDRMLDGQHLRRFRALILPNIAALSDGQCSQLREYVAGGGSLIATHETSLYNEWGERRQNFGLSDVFGVRYGGKMEGPMKNAYLRLEHPHVLLKGLEDAPRIIHGAYRLPVEPIAEFREKPVTLIPAYPDLPMEMVYPRVAKTDIAEVYVREQGRGRVAYFNWDIDRIFWEVLTNDHGLLLRNTVDWATRGERPVFVEGRGTLDVTVWRQASSMTVHLVNLTNPMMMKGPFRELIPSGEQRVRVKLPNGVKVKKAWLLAADRAAGETVRNGWLEARVGSVLDHEILAVDLS